MTESGDPVEAAIQQAKADVESERKERLAEVASRPYFSPRELGATAPLDCDIWTIDLEDRRGGDPEQVTRQLGDAGVDKQLGGLLRAGLKVRP